MIDNRTTELLRKMLDERGVEYTTDDGKYLKETCWVYMGELMATFVEFENGETRFELDHWCFTPEQAIAATLGSERERKLELLVKQLWYLINHRSGYGYAAALEAIEELGIEVDERARDRD